MGGKKKYSEMFGSFVEPFNCDVVCEIDFWLSCSKLMVISSYLSY